MPRPRKWRNICAIPRCNRFNPENDEKHGIVEMTVDEFETVRLIDLEGLTQEQCAEQMGVARTTAQAIYQNARKKLADCIVNGLSLTIGGGEYRVCGHHDDCCGHKHCRGHFPAIDENELNGGLVMKKIAVTYEEGNVFGHFGQTENFKLYDINDGQIASAAVVDTNGNGHGALAGFLRNAGVDTLICGGIGAGAKHALAEAGIMLYGGVSGNADQAVEALLAQKLIYDSDAECDHHDEHHHDSCHKHDGDCGHNC